MTTIDKDEDMISLSSKQMEQLRKELHERISREELGHGWQLEALDRIITVSEMNPAAFHRIWIQALLTAGLSLEAAIAHIVASYFQPNYRISHNTMTNESVSSMLTVCIHLFLLVEILEGWSSDATARGACLLPAS